jgi:hypothetical protein
VGRTSIYWRWNAKAGAKFLAWRDLDANYFAANATRDGSDGVKTLLRSRNVRSGKYRKENQNAKAQKPFDNSEPFHFFPFFLAVISCRFDFPVIAQRSRTRCLVQEL